MKTIASFSFVAKEDIFGNVRITDRSVESCITYQVLSP